MGGKDIAGLEFTIWQITLQSLGIAVTQMVTVLLVSSMTGYALSRMKFPGRKGFLSFTLILHGFPQITLLIPIFFVLRYLSDLPAVGGIIGFNTIGGIAMVMVAFELPLGVWLMKGFFDNIPWDMERSAMIDGASRWRTYWQILLPQIRPGLLALGIFAFLSGWNAFLVPQTYSVGSQASNITVFMNQLISETAPTNWNQVAAVGMFQLVPVFIFFIFAQEYLLNIYAGGTKGAS
jgi:inositol-phosphate transport system permease protein